jgi:hypothetical protein
VLALHNSLIYKLTQTYSTRYDVIVGFTEAIFGTEKDIVLSHLETCDTCGGSGSKAGSKTRICSTCGGRGQVMRTEQTPFGLFSQVIMENSVCFVIVLLPLPSSFICLLSCSLAPKSFISSLPQPFFLTEAYPTCLGLKDFVVVV